ncbi:RNA polymerase III transcription factor IIIC subunit domain-containing protein [Trichoderma sp. SZMC 28015]
MDTPRQEDVGIGSSGSIARNPAQDRREDGAPRYAIPPRELTAVEIPAVVEDVDRAVKAFGRVPSLRHVLDPLRNSIPLYINPEEPFCPPIMSHNARSHNVVLKVTVPKRTGRKRKRGTDEPWQGDIELQGADTSPSENSENVCSIARLDDPRLLRRKLEDNVDKYHVEAVGMIKHTHRFRGLADFYWDMDKSSFAQRFVDQVLPGDVEKLKEFKFTPGIDQGSNVDIIPPPIFTHMSLPFNYFYSQNPYVRLTEDGGTVNTTAVKQVGHFIGTEDAAPTGPQIPPDMTDPRMVEVIAQLEEAFEDRPVWTRRSLLNHLAGKLRNWNELKKYLNYAAYQFKGGPWRDGVVPYGIDPRTDPKYRIYQTLMFKLPKQKRARKDQTWQSLRRVQMGRTKEFVQELSASHMFDGETYHTDGKVWQVCDITDPLLRELLDNAEVRSTWDVSSGWYHGGLWAKVKAIMKTKLVAIQFGRQLTKEDFAPTLQCGDQTPIRSTSATFHLPLPNLNLTTEELTQLRGREPSKKKSQVYNVRVRPRAKIDVDAMEGQSVVTSHDADADADLEADAEAEAASILGRMEQSEDSEAGSDDDDDEDEDDEENDNGSGDEDGMEHTGFEGDEDDYGELDDEYTMDSSHPFSGGPWFCKHCQKPFSVWEHLVEHKKSKRNENKEDHIHCKFCGRDFHTLEGEMKHMQVEHPLEQNIDCPGCGQGPFKRLGSLMSHIERGFCTRIDSDLLDELREEKLEFPRRLEQLTKESIMGNYMKYLPSPNADNSISGWHVEKEQPSFKMVPEEFPDLSTTAKAQGPGRLPLRLLSDINRDNNIEAPSSVQRPQPIFKSGVNTVVAGMDPDDPNNPSFNVARYRCPITEKWNCPKVPCRKVFKTAKALIGHLRSPAHGNKTYRCPCCLKMFKTLAGITSHAETRGSKCRIQDTVHYEIFMGQLTAGIVDIERTRYQDGSIIFKTSEQAKQRLRGEVKENKSKDPIDVGPEKVYW